VSRPPQTPIDQNITAALHRAGAQWRAVVARRENGSCRVLESREFSLSEVDQIETWLLQHQAGRVIVVLPASMVICRTTILPDAAPDELRAALALQAETHIEGTAPAHRQAMAVLHPAAGETNRTGLILAWPQRSLAPELPLSEYIPSYTADIACLAALMNGARSNDPVLWIDRREGSIALALGHAQGVVFRAASEQGDEPAEWRSGVLRLIAETALNVGHTDEFTDDLIEAIGGAMASSADPAQLLLPDGIAVQAGRRLKGAKIDRQWWNRYAIPAGALLATLDQLDSLTQLRAAPPLTSPSGAERLVERLSRWRTAAALLITALVLLGVGPLAFAGARLLVLKWKVGGDLEAFEQAQRERESRLLMYLELSHRTWSMAKLLADIANSAPQGITIDTVRLDASGNEVDVRGTADTPETVNEFNNVLSGSGVFGNVVPGYTERDQSSGNISFTLRAEVKSPYLRPQYEDDFGETPLAVRMFGERARPGGPRLARGGSRNSDSSGEDTGLDEAEENEEGEPAIARGDDDEFGRTGPRGPRAPVRIPTEAREGAAAPEMPPILSRDEIDKLSSSDVQAQLLKIVNARNNKSQYTAEQGQQIDEQYQLLMARLRAGRGGEL